MKSSPGWDSNSKILPIGPMPRMVEDGKTFAENARKKAIELALYLKEWVLNEDSGLVVPALNGCRPGNTRPLRGQTR